MKSNQNQKDETKENQSGDWLTVGENLVRYVPSGKYYSRIRTGGKLFRQSLKTDSITTAKLRLADLEKSLRTMTERKAQLIQGRMTMGDALKIFQDRKAQKKPNTKLYYENRIKALFKKWPELKAMDARKLTQNDCQEWANRASTDMDDTAFNNTLGIIKNACKIAVEFGARLDNPAESLKRVKVKAKELTLPSSEQFKAIVNAIAKGNGNRNRFSQPCADLVQFLAYSGCRKDEAQYVTWADVDLTKGFITIRGNPETGTKNSESRPVPILPDMRTLIERIQSERPKRKDTDAVMTVTECEKSLTHACEDLKIARITHHDLRHLFATRAIESGVPIQTVARWMGHRDGGALAMKTYGHLRACY